MVDNRQGDNRMGAEQSSRSAVEWNNRAVGEERNSRMEGHDTRVGVVGRNRIGLGVHIHPRVAYMWVAGLAGWGNRQVREGCY